MPTANLIVGNDASNTLLGTAGRDLVYGFDPNGPQGTVTSITATLVANTQQPVFACAPPDDLERLFIVGRLGEIRILNLATGQFLPDSFLDISAQVTTAGEGGLLGLAFDPDFASNGYFYVDFTNLSGDTEIRRYKVSDADPNVADPASATTIITIDQPASTNHKAGWLGFGPDGYLYAALGDGGGSNDPSNNGQNADTLLGKMLRLDVRSDAFPGDNLRNYAIPADNPFVGVAGADEIYALGLRNPWRNSFDRGLGDFYIGDVGQNAIEEVNLGAAGANYGWDSFEGTFPHNATPLGPGILTDPIYQYDHTVGHAIAGGYVYRGGSEGLQGVYFFADYTDDKVFTLRFDGTAWVATDRTAQLVPNVPGAITNLASFGEDGAGNLYLMDFLGRVFRLTPVVASADTGDVVYGFAGDDMLFGGSGADKVNGGSGTDTMLGGLGNDTYTVDLAGDMVIEAANEGTDIVFASAGYALPGGSAIETLRVSGTAGLSLAGNELANTLIGSTGNDTLNGGDGNDRLNGGAGVDTMTGGAGNDTYTVDNDDQVAEAAFGGADTIYTTVDYELVGGQEVEILRVSGAGALSLAGNELTNTLIGGAGNDTLNDGGAGNDWLYGGAGNDTLNDGAGNDTLNGGDGNDRLNGGAGVDTMTGGDGNDIYTVDNDADQVVEAAFGGADTIYATVDYELAGGQEVEILRVSGAGALSLAGNELANTLIGGAGNDTLNGSDGLDRLLGGAGSDRLTGGLHIDRLEGGIGNDTLEGGAANDTLIGGTGADTFLYSAGDGDDRFTDFSAAQGDKVELSGVTVGSMVNNVATLSDGHVLTAQAGYVWTAADFI